MKQNPIPDYRLSIPANIKYEVRQRCGYGCVICGYPFFDYDHMTPYKIVKEHRAENITLLCGNHHNLKSSKALSEEVVRQHNDQPYAIVYGKPLTYKHKLPMNSNITVGMASNKFIVDTNKTPSYAPFAVNNKLPFKFKVENGILLLSFYAEDSQAKKVFEMVENEIVLNTKCYDIQKRGPLITIWKHQEKLFLNYY